MLVNTGRILLAAQAGRYAVGGFNITSLESALGIIAGAEAEKSPVILQVSEKTVDYMSLEVAYAIARALADKSPLPVAVHLDHGKNFELAERALRQGFSSIMLDVSKLPLAERIPKVRAFVTKAHKNGATVEAEEDIIGGREDYVQGDHGHLTNPKRAKVFVAESGCDSFAVSIGESHGKPVPGEKLDLELLSEIRAAVTVPLVLHGASSTDPQIIREAVSRGICKINIDTDLRLAFTRQLRETLKEPDIYDPRDELRPGIGEITDVVREKIRLFGSSGKAS
jgi:fructose-bisphosphate aldolase class II